MGLAPSPGRRTGRGGQSAGMEKSSIFAKTLGSVQGRDAQPWTSRTAWHSDALATPCQPDGASLLPL